MHNYLTRMLCLNGAADASATYACQKLYYGRKIDMGSFVKQTGGRTDEWQLSTGSRRAGEGLKNAAYGTMESVYSIFFFFLLSLNFFSYLFPRLIPPSLSCVPPHPSSSTQTCPQSPPTFFLRTGDRGS